MLVFISAPFASMHHGFPHRPASPMPATARPFIIPALAPQSSNNPLKIVRSVVLDLDSPALFSMVNRDVGGQMLLQAILQILYCRCRCRSNRSRAPRFASSATNAKQAGNHPLRRTHRGVAAQNCFRSEQLFFRRFQRQQHLRVSD